MKKRMVVLLALALLCALLLPAAVAEESAGPDILAVYYCPEAQIITGEDQSKELVDTVVFLWQDYTYVQYVDHGHRYEVYSNGSFEMNFDWQESGWQDKAPHILTVHVRQIHGTDHQPHPADLTYDINLDRVTDYCLYPDDTRTGLKLVAAFMQVDKQKLVKTDGSEEYLPTVWFYYDDGSFQQYAVLDGQENVLFSAGEYQISGGFTEAGSVLALHRTQKYQDGTGLADYDSTHDYVIGELDFIRIYP